MNIDYFNPIQIKQLFEMQDELNKVVNENWIDQKYEWYRAIYTEAVEVVEHHRWKWWSKKEPDMDNLRLELIDVLHFVLSAIIQKNNGDINQCILEYNEITTMEPVDEPDVDLTILDVTEQLISVALITKYESDDTVFMMELLHVLFNLADMDLTNVYQQYVGKHALNIFRQKNGYKEGTYHREWHGEDDSVWLLKIMSRMTRTDIADTVTYPDKVMTELTNTYSSIFHTS